MIPFRFPETFPPLPGGAVLQNLLESVQPPPWLVDELQNRLVLFLNHVLQQEPVAQGRVRQQRGRVARLVWGRFELWLRATPAGLIERVPAETTRLSTLVPADLTVTLADDAWMPVFQALLRGEKPRVNIEGDVQLAAEVAWLADNLRWDVEEDLSRVLGDVMAHNLLAASGLVMSGIRSFVGRSRSDAGESTA